MSRLLEFPLRHREFTVVVFVMLIALGLNSWLSIPQSEDPSIDFPAFTVVAVYPGASPADMERLVVKDVEASLHELDNIKSIASRCSDGVATIRVEFQFGQDPEKKYDEVLRQMNAIRSELPPDLAEFKIYRATTLDVAIAELALVSPTMPYSRLDRIAEDLTDQLGTVPGVRRAERWAAPARQVDVMLDLGRLSQLHLPPALVLQAIAGESVDLPAGAVETGTRRFSVKSSGAYESLPQIENTVLRTAAGQSIRVGDVAQVRWGYADSTFRARYDGVRAELVTVTMQDGQRIGAVRDRVWAALDRFERELPDGVHLVRGFDQAQNVSHRLGHLQTDFMIAIALVAITLLPLGLRAAGIVMVSIPLSLAMGVTLLNLTGFSLNQLSIVGGVIALGLLVDDSIVVVENITRFLREGHTRLEAAILATRQIAVAVVGATATLVLAFVPLLTLPGGAGEYIRSLPAAVIYTVLASLLVSLTIIPWLASMVLPREESREGNRLLRGFERVIHRTYAPVLDRALDRPKLTLAISALLVAGSLLLVPVVGFSLFPKAETPQFYVNITAPEGSDIAATDSAARFAERVIGRSDQVRGIFTAIGHDNPQVYYNVAPRRDDPRVGQLFVLLKTYDERTTPHLLDSLRTVLAGYPGAKIELREFANGPPIDAPVALRITGPNLDSLRTLAGRVERAMDRTPGTQFVNNPLRLDRTDLRVALDRGKAGLLGIPTEAFDRTLRLSLAGVPAGVLREPDGKARNVVVRLASHTPDPATLNQVYIASRGGAMTPLREIANVHFETSVPVIQRYDRVRSVTVTSYVRAGYNTGKVTQAVLGNVRSSLHLPTGYHLTVAGEVESRNESFGGVGSAILVATFLILGILVLEFRTFRGMLIVASVIPLGMMGGILALLASGNTLSFTATIGFVALIGIEIKTSILLVDLTNQLRAQGMSLHDAVRRAGEVRFLPIVLTSMTAIGGLLPLAISGEGLYAPLAWVIIGGLVTSTLLARVVTPVLYQLLAPAVEPAGH